VRGDGRLRVAPPTFVPCSPERRVETMRALRVLYLDFIEGGGLNELRLRRGNR
jgi:hypothetical protein